MNNFRVLFTNYAKLEEFYPFKSFFMKENICKNLPNENSIVLLNFIQHNL